MRPILICVFVHAILINATPHGYGANSGAGAVANAGAAAGAFGAPVSVPVGEGYTGSFSKSSSSSFAASSASSSAFSFSGSGLNGNSEKCATGSCLNKELLSGNNHSPNEYNNNHNTASTGNTNSISQGSNNFVNGAKAAAGAEAGAFAVNSIPQCTGNNCAQNECKGANCNIATSSKCTTGACNSSPPEQVRTSNEPNKNCVSGLCGSALGSEAKPYESYPHENDNSKNNCASGQCSDTPPKNPSSYSSGPKCTGYECATSNIAFTPHDSGKNVGQSGPTSDSNPTFAAGSQKCTTGHCATPHFEAIIPASGISDIYVNTGKNKDSKSSYDTNIYGELESNEKPLKKSGPSSDCTGAGNCVPIKPIISIVNLNPPYGAADTSKCKYPNNCNDINNYPLSSNSGSAPAYNKPVNFLTTPKQGPSCTSSNCGIVKTSPTTSYLGFDSSQIQSPSSNLIPSIPQSSNNPTPPENKCTSPFCATPSQNSYREPVPSELVNSNVPIIKPIVSSVIFPQHSYVNKPLQTGPHQFHSQETYTSGAANPQSIIPNQNFGHPTTSSPIPNLPANNPFLTASSLNKEPNRNLLPAFVPLMPSDSTACGGSIECSVNKYPSHNHEPLKPSYTQPALTPVAGSSFSHGVPNIGVQSGFNSHVTANKLHNSHDVQYNGGFGGPPGVLKPNDFSHNGQVSNTKPASNYPPTSCSFGACNNNENKKDFLNPKPSATQNPVLCSTGNCDSHSSNQHNIHNRPSTPTGAHAAAIAAASASAGIYTGGFGGPPGFLKPYDDGKISPPLSTNNDAKHTITTQFGAQPKHPQTAISPSLQKETALNTGAQAFAAAGANSGVIGAYPSSNYGKLGDSSHNTHNGCDGGCTANGNIDGLGVGYSGIVGKADIGAGAHAGTHAGAISGASAGAFDLGRSFASSSATAHASAGAAIKGYGRR